MRRKNKLGKSVTYQEEIYFSEQNIEYTRLSDVIQGSIVYVNVVSVSLYLASESQWTSKRNWPGLQPT